MCVPHRAPSIDLVLAEMQPRVLWEEILKRFSKIEIVGEPERVRPNFVRGYKRLPVRVSAN